MIKNFQVMVLCFNIIKHITLLQIQSSKWLQMQAYFTQSWIFPSATQEPFLVEAELQ